MANNLASLTGGCVCGAVRFVATGDPLRVGLCHCMTCRKAHASAFNPFVVFARAQVTVTGNLASWHSSSGESREFCPQCGARIGIFTKTAAELSLGSFDDINVFQPQYEAWTLRREAWVRELERPQFSKDRTSTTTPLPSFLPIK